MIVDEQDECDVLPSWPGSQRPALVATAAHALVGEVEDYPRASGSRAGTHERSRGEDTP